MPSIRVPQQLLADMRCSSCDSGSLRYLSTLMFGQGAEERLVACLSCDRVSAFVELTHELDPTDKQ